MTQALRRGGQAPLAVYRAGPAALTVGPLPPGQPIGEVCCDDGI
jgi:hypothetical protein